MRACIRAQLESACLEHSSRSRCNRSDNGVVNVDEDVAFHSSLEFADSPSIIILEGQALGLAKTWAEPREPNKAPHTRNNAAHAFIEVH
jgi:hypothetical protein